jgi:NAD(P)-dependent dehydrogenase (short-subunit alcohol dehydrogenase family)
MKTSLVVGAAGGMGLEVARVLVARGDRVIGTVLDAAQESQLKAEVAGIDRILQLDLSDAEATLSAVSGIANSVDRLDDIVVCAALAPVGPVEHTSLKATALAMNINYLAAVAIFQGAIAKLRDSKGRLVLISSMAGKTQMPFIGAYTASKHAIEGMADIMRQEVAAQGVKIIIVEPGGVKTPMVSDQIAAVARDIAALTPEIDARYGHLYRGFHAAASGSLHSDEGTRPGDVADVVLEALNAPEPETRYIVGEDAKAFIAGRAQMSDREADAMMASFFAGA